MKILLLAFLLAWGNPQSGHTGGNPDRGLQIFNAYCAGCHGLNGRGDGPMAARLARDHGVTPTDLAALDVDETSLVAMIREGSTRHRSGFMPAWGLTLNEEQTTDLVAFVRELQTADQPISARIFDVQETLELGRILYGLRCLACHGVSGRGDGAFMPAGKKAPDLGDVRFIRKKTDEELTQIIDQGPDHSKIPNTWEHPLQSDEIRALIFFLRSLQLNR